jgi:hypothetical protein
MEDAQMDVSEHDERRSVRLPPFLLAFMLAAALAGVAASPAWAQAKAHSTIRCTSSSTLSVTWSFSEFPAGENEIKEQIKLDGTFVFEGLFAFTGSSAQNSVTIGLSPGHHEITVFAHWNGNGVKGQSDHRFLNGIECATAQPPSSPLTPGYWKNHLSGGSPNTQQYLAQSIGNYRVETTEQASAIFIAMNCGSSTSQSAIGCLAGQLLASELNLANGSPSCIAAAVAKANSWLAGNTQDGVAGVVYAGPSATYTLTQDQRTEALALKHQFATYNSKGECL